MATGEADRGKGEREEEENSSGSKYC